MNDMIAAAIAAAQEKAAQFQPMPQMPLRPRTLADALASASTAVDHWLGVNEYGLYIDKDKKALFETIPVEIDLKELRFGFGVRFQVGPQVQYGRSFDGIREMRSGLPWSVLVAEAQRSDPKCKGSYDLAQIAMTLTVPLTRRDRSKIEPGARLGYTTSITGYALFMQYLAAAVTAFGEDAVVPTTLGWTTRKGPTGDYGLVTFAVRT